MINEKRNFGLIPFIKLDSLPGLRNYNHVPIMIIVKKIHQTTKSRHKKNV